jgi:hypothetical protein
MKYRAILICAPWAALMIVETMASVIFDGVPGTGICGTGSAPVP